MKKIKMVKLLVVSKYYYALSKLCRNRFKKAYYRGLAKGYYYDSLNSI